MTHLFVDGLTVIDCSYLHPQRGIVGESWIADIVLSGDLDEEGVVFDFSLAKKAIKNTIDSTADHALIIPLNDPRLHLEKTPEQFKLSYQTDSGFYYEYSSPEQGLCLLDVAEINEENLCAYLKQKIMTVLPENVKNLKINLRTEVIDGAFYHYSHGLKKHYGNCQRMAHGHRSRIIIEKEGLRQKDLEINWANRWQDIYLGSREDLKEEQIRDGKAYYYFEYTGNQGPFSLLIAKELCEIIDTDTTVELLGGYIHQTLTQEYGCGFSVKAFEGVEKGALVLG